MSKKYNNRESKKIKRAAAEARQVEYDKLTTAQKLARLPKGGAMRQRARLEKQLADEQGVK